MRIFWDGYGIENPYSGIGNYAYNLATQFKEKNIPIQIIGTMATQSLWQGVNVLTLKSGGPFAKIFDSKIIWPIRSEMCLLNSPEFSQNEKTILHGLSNINISIKKNSSKTLKRVVTIHDLIPLLCPQNVSKSYFYQFKYLLPQVVHHVDAIVCVSEWTKKTLIDFYPDVESKVIVIPNGYNFKEKKSTNLEKSDEKTHVLFVSRFEKYKNFDLILQLLKAEEAQMIVSIVTNEYGVSWLQQHCQDFIKNRVLNVFCKISEDELNFLYQSHDVYIHPSNYEGFCLPAAEALSYYLPVVYMSGSGIDEVVGSKVGIAMERDQFVEDWIEAIHKAKELKSNADFSTNIERHLKHLFSWKQAAEKLIATYDSL